MGRVCGCVRPGMRSERALENFYAVDSRKQTNDVEIAFVWVVIPLGFGQHGPSSNSDTRFRAGFMIRASGPHDPDPTRRLALLASSTSRHVNDHRHDHDLFPPFVPGIGLPVVSYVHTYMKFLSCFVGSFVVDFFFHVRADADACGCCVV